MEKEIEVVNEVVDEVEQTSDELKQQLEEYESQKKEEVAQKLAESKANLESKSKDNPYTIEELFDSKYYKEAIHYRITTCFYATRYFLNEKEFLSDLYRGCEDIEACIEKSRFYFEAIKQSAARLIKRERLFIINVVNDSLVEAMGRLNDERKNKEAQSKIESKVDSKVESNVESVEESLEVGVSGPGPKVADSADIEPEEKEYDYGTYAAAEAHGQLEDDQVEDQIEDQGIMTADEVRAELGDNGSFEYTDFNDDEVVVWYSWVKDRKLYITDVDGAATYQVPANFYTFIQDIKESGRICKLNRS